MIVLGLHGGTHRGFDMAYSSPLKSHDAAAVLMRDNEILAAVEEERISRYKHSTSFPELAIRACLEESGLGLDQVDAFAFGGSQEYFDHFASTFYFEQPTRETKSGIEALTKVFGDCFGIQVPENKFHFCDHHLAHARSAFACADFDDALVVTMDGEGENSSMKVFLGKGSRLTLLRSYPVNKSIGYFYQQAIQALGYRLFDEFKVMGLAPYGSADANAEMMSELCQLGPNGNYKLKINAQLKAVLQKYGWIHGARRSGEAFSRDHKDLAAAIQAVSERIILHTIGHFKKKTGAKNLCLAGGVAHNCSANGRIKRELEFEQLFVQSAAHDAGIALGAAIDCLEKKNCVRTRPSKKVPSRLTCWLERKLKKEEFSSALRVDQQGSLLGRSIGNSSEIKSALKLWKGCLHFEEVKNIEKFAAKLLDQGAVIGWVQGRSEFGPRALGNRSILADPRPLENKSRINKMVKKREGYRPFAPTVLEDGLATYFETTGMQSDFAFMNVVHYVRPEYREVLGAVTHVDGSARVQTVNQKQNPRFARLIEEFKAVTGLPMVLNTSFNNRDEPIVDSVYDACVCFLTTDIDQLIIGDFQVSKSEPMLRITDWYLQVSPNRRLIWSPGSRSYALEKTLSDGLSGAFSIQISPESASVLFAANGSKTLKALLLATNVPKHKIVAEIYDLWCKRAILVSPELIPNRYNESSQ